MSRIVVKSPNKTKNRSSGGVRRASASEVRRIYAGLPCDRPSLWSGFGSVLDLGGSIERDLNLGMSSKANHLAMARDWRAVGADLARSIKSFASHRLGKVGHENPRSS